jgi:hypothetical protein
MTTLTRSNFQDHPFHLVSPSPWPLYTSISLFTLTVNGALSMHLFSNSYILFFIALGTVVASMSLWFRDIISEGTLKSKINSYYNLNIAKAIPAEDISKALSDYKNQNDTAVFTNHKDDLGYYLAGLLEGDGSISLPSSGVTTLNRVLNPRIVFTSHIDNLGTTQKIEHVNTALSLYKQHIKEVSTKDIIPPYRYSIFVGLLLSSGWVNIHNRTKVKTRIKFCQPYENKDYIYHVFREISIYCEKDPYRFVSDRFFKGKPVDNLLITTRWMYCFNNLYYMFYNKNGKKIVPNNIYDLLTPLVLAYWVMGSGFKLQGRGLILYTNYFNTIDVVKLINILIIKYRLECRLLFVKNKPCIYIYRDSLGNLIIKIKPYILSSRLKKFI